MGLSDNKRKQRLVGSASGRNAAWSGNEALPGQRLLASMGWQAGQGLGTSQQGMSAPVTMAFKLDNKGIGARRHEREARASGKVDAWIGGGGDLGSLFERLNRAATSANAEEGAAHGDDDDDDDDDDKSQEAGEAEKGKGEKKRKRDKDDKKKRKEEKRKAKEERLDDKGNKGKGKEKAPEDSGVAKVEHKPIRQAHRARFLRAKRLVNGSDAVSLNEILGIASPSSGSPAPNSSKESPVPFAPPPAAAEAATAESKEGRKKRKREEKEREKEERKRKGKAIKEDETKKSKSKKSRGKSISDGGDDEATRPPCSDPSFEAGSGNVVSPLSVQDYLQGRLMQRRAALIRRQRAEQDAVWQRAAAVGAA